MEVKGTNKRLESPFIFPFLAPVVKAECNGKMELDLLKLV